MSKPIPPPSATPCKVIHRSQNTFSFFVKVTPKKKKQVVIKQFTDFTGTLVAEDFPNGSWATWVYQFPVEMPDREAVDRAGAHLIKDYHKHK